MSNLEIFFSANNEHICDESQIKYIHFSLKQFSNGQLMCRQNVQMYSAQVHSSWTLYEANIFNNFILMFRKNPMVWLSSVDDCLIRWEWVGKGSLHVNASNDPKLIKSVTWSGDKVDSTAHLWWNERIVSQVPLA